MATPQRTELRCECFVAERGRPRVIDIVIERLQQPCGLSGCDGAFGVGVPADGMMIEYADPQPAGESTDLVDVRPDRRRGDDGVADPGSVSRVQQRRRISNGAAHAVLDRQPVLLAEGSERDASLARLQPDQTTT